MLPEGHDATQAGFRQCSHRRGRYIMKVFSNSPTMAFCAASKLSRLLSLLRWLNSPPRISSQLGPQTILSICLPVIRLRGRAVGLAFISGALCRWS